VILAIDVIVDAGYNRDMKISDTLKVQYLDIPDDRIDQRLDNLLINLLKGVPKSRIYRLLRKGEIRVNKKRVKPDYRIQQDDVLRLPPIYLEPVIQKPLNPKLQKIQLLKSHIIEDQKNWMVLNKPSGIAVHGGSGLSFGVIEALRVLFPELPYLELVHRIDRETSGVLLIAKRRSTLRFLHQQLREKTMKKTYLCMVHGKWPDKLTRIQTPIIKTSGRNGERIMQTSDEGKASDTCFKVIECSRHTSLLEVMPITGRTHQIRVHCASAGYPIWGDNKYRQESHLIENEKNNKVSRLMLHALKLKFQPSSEDSKQMIQAPIDESFANIMSCYGFPAKLIGMFS